MGGLVAGDEHSGGSEGWGAIGAAIEVAAVMEDDIGGAATAGETIDFLGEPASDALGGGLAPVRGHGVP